jgi:hypothetical protein
MDESVKSRGGFAALLPPRGLDFSRYSDIPRFVVLRPVLSSGSQHPSVDLVDDQANHSPLLDGAFNTARPGTLVFHPPQACRIAAFDTISPWEPAFTWLAAQPSKAGAEAREPIVHALAATDAQVLFDGGWMIPLGQEAHVRPVRETMLSLPAAPFHLSKSQQQPAVVRMAWHLGRTWCYVVNESAEAIDVDLRWSCPAGTRCRILPRGGEQPLASHEENGSRVAVSLPAYGLWAFVIDDATARLTDVQVKMPEAALAALDQRVRQLGQRITEAHAAVKKHGTQRETLLANPGFEAAPAVRNELPGWEPPVGNAALWALDTDNPRSGKSSLMLTADGDDGASLYSRLALEEHRLVNISAWLRSDREETDVRLVFEATMGNEVFRENSDVRVDTLETPNSSRSPSLRPWDDARVQVEMRSRI